MNIKKDYLDVVCVQEKELGFKLLCEAPWISHIRDGEEVIVGADSDKMIEGTVIASWSGRRDSDVVEFMKKVFDVDKLNRIICRFERIDMEYEEETEDAVQEVV